ncbi:MAG: hypothetical protein LUG19_02965, partial [Desulfovibrio sp.]|uniref:hypothetical protein n=1 Tax=Desulfovibrio sp. TaxID=885 RepID=UPI0025886D57
KALQAHMKNPRLGRGVSFVGAGRAPGGRNAFGIAFWAEKSQYPLDVFCSHRRFWRNKTGLALKRRPVSKPALSAVGGKCGFPVAAGMGVAVQRRRGGAHF